MTRHDPVTPEPRVMVLGPHAPPSGGVATFLQILFGRLKEGKRYWYGYGDKPCSAKEKQVCMINRYDPGWKVWRRRHTEVVVDSATVFLEYPRPHLVWHWFLALSVRRVRWLKVVHDVSLPERFASFRPFHRWHVRIAARFVWRFVAVSEELGEWLGREITSSQKVIVIPSLLGVGAPGDASSVPPDFNQLCEASDYVICAVGAMTEEYGFKHVVEAVCRLQARHACRYGLLLLCTDFTEQEGYIDSLKALFPRVTILVNAPHPAVLAMFQRCDAVVRSVRHESYGLSRVEALSQGTPVVATRTGETRGMLCYDYADIEALVKQLEFALSDEARLRASRWAQFYRHEAEANLRRWLQVIDEAGHSR